MFHFYAVWGLALKYVVGTIDSACTLIASSIVQDTLIANKDGVTVSGSSIDSWVTVALNDTYFYNGLTMWQTLDRVRFVTALLGFAGYSNFINELIFSITLHRCLVCVGSRGVSGCSCMQEESQY